MLPIEIRIGCSQSLVSFQFFEGRLKMETRRKHVVLFLFKLLLSHLTELHNYLHTYVSTVTNNPVDCATYFIFKNISSNTVPIMDTCSLINLRVN